MLLHAFARLVNTSALVAELPTAAALHVVATFRFFDHCLAKGARFPILSGDKLLKLFICILLLFLALAALVTRLLASYAEVLLATRALEFRYVCFNLHRVPALWSRALKNSLKLG